MRCTDCGTLSLVVYRVADVGGSYWPPRCPVAIFDVDTVSACRGRLEMAPQPGDYTIDAKEPFQRTEVWRDVYDRNPATGEVERHQRLEVVDSVHKMRTIEADSERRFRNGEGEPMRFRALSQNRSNLDVGSFGAEGSIGAQTYDSGRAPVKSGKVSVTKHGAKKPQVKVARGGGQTALKG